MKQSNPGPYRYAVTRKLLRVVQRILVLPLYLWCICPATAQEIVVKVPQSVNELLETACIKCHESTTDSALDIAKLNRETIQSDQVHQWEKIFDRVSAGDMPPKDEPRPNVDLVAAAISSLKTKLVENSLRDRGESRTTLRRLTRLEYGYTLQDLLGIDEAIALDLIELLPDEPDTGTFDTLAINQNISPLHIQKYLDVAELALDSALKIGPKPKSTTWKTKYVDSPTLGYIADTRGLGLGIIKRLDDAYVSFFDFGATYTFHSISEGFQVPVPGRYRITFDAYPYQAKSSVGMAVYKGKLAGVAASLDELIATFDLQDGQSGPYEIVTFMRPGDLVSPSPYELDGNPHSAARGKPTEGYDMSKYDGEGVAIRSLSIEGPLGVEHWPPNSTRSVLKGVRFNESGEVVLDKPAEEHVAEIIASFGPKAFRRPLRDGELQAYASMAYPQLDAGRSFSEAIRVPLRAILTSPDFLFHTVESAQLNDYEFASRISYFLWRSLPDDSLTIAAGRGDLSDKTLLKEQIQRMVRDEKFKRFVKDFSGQAYRLYEIKNTAPDPGLYPEYDDRLGRAIAMESEMFLYDVFINNLEIENLVDSDFTYANRRLATHYGISDVDGQNMRRISLTDDCERGGLITHASILKITANGTTTSPVVRGNFILTNILGEQTAPPPAGVGNIEPDTRGAKTIRELLDAHRSNATCNSCHRQIDPPGFALESFDPIGGWRTNYRISGGMMQYGDYKFPAPYKSGLPVDASGTTANGTAFKNISEYKEVLLETRLHQIARNFTSQLIAFSTGAAVQFADRDAVESVLDHTRDQSYPVTDIIESVILTELFRSH